VKEQAHFSTASSSFGKGSCDEWIATLKLHVTYEHGTRKSRKTNQGKDSNTRNGGGKKNGEQGWGRVRQDRRKKKKGKKSQGKIEELQSRAFCLKCSERLTEVHPAYQCIT